MNHLRILYQPFLDQALSISFGMRQQGLRLPHHRLSMDAFANRLAVVHGMDMDSVPMPWDDA